MSPSNGTALIQSLLLNIAQTLATTRQRRLVVLSGELSWTEQCLKGFLAQQEAEAGLLISTTQLAERDEILPAAKLLHHLGTEVSYLIWNGHDGLHPDAFGAAAGLVQGGGIMILLIPELSKFSSAPDADYQRMCATEDELRSCGSRFLARFASILQSEPGVILLQQGATEKEIQSRISKGLASLRPEPIPESVQEYGLVGDQQTALDAITRIVTGHRNRPLVIHADRGRGKSSVMGMAAANFGCKVVITAPQKRSAQKAFEHYQRCADVSGAGRKSGKAGLTFFPPEELASARIEADLVLVDEAAALPVDILASILRHYPRVVFATTVHGYEGTGQGFNIRFSRILDDHCPGWKSLQMHSPIRWSGPDLVEAAVFRLLALAAEPAEITADFRVSPNPELRFVSQDELARNEDLLAQVMGLLVLAHYQTSPSDLRMLLDQPNFHVLVCQQEEVVLGAALCTEESLAGMPELHTDIIQGKRRLKGKLVPQSLASFHLDSQLLSMRFLRIIRITVHPDLFRQGIGKRMLEKLEEFSHQKGFDFLCVSYAFSPTVHDFWSDSGFRTVRLGYSRDSNSGSQSLLALLEPDNNSEYLHKLKAEFQAHLQYGLSRYFRHSDWRLIRALLTETEEQINDIDEQEQEVLQLFSQSSRNEFDSLQVLEKILLQAASDGRLQQLSSSCQQLLVMRVLQQRDWPECVTACGLSGKKDALAQLREAFAAFYRQTAR